jgi:hypothetical protein
MGVRDSGIISQITQYVVKGLGGDITGWHANIVRVLAMKKYQPRLNLVSEHRQFDARK